MRGHDLKEAKYQTKALTEEEIWAVFSTMFSTKVARDTSYKFGFFKSILDNLYNTDEEYLLSFDQLFRKFTEIYWNLVLKYNLRQKAKTKDGKETVLEKILHQAAVDYNLGGDICYEAVSEETRNEICQKVKKSCKVNVVGALYGDSDGTLYSFSRKDEFIKLNPCMYDFMTQHKMVLEKINYFEWAKFLEKVNDETSTRNLLNNLDAITKRNNLSAYRDFLSEVLKEQKCFYCGKDLRKSKIHVDHFIPWTFIKDDNLWNLVLSCSDCNLNKSDKLPSQIYLAHLSERNETIFQRNPKRLPANYSSKRLLEVYNYAKANGFSEIWTPKGKEASNDNP